MLLPYFLLLHEVIGYFFCVLPSFGASSFCASPLEFSFLLPCIRVTSPATNFFFLFANAFSGIQRPNVFGGRISYLLLHINIHQSELFQLHTKFQYICCVVSCLVLPYQYIHTCTPVGPRCAMYKLTTCIFIFLRIQSWTEIRSGCMPASIGLFPSFLFLAGLFSLGSSLDFFLLRFQLFSYYNIVFICGRLSLTELAFLLLLLLNWGSQLQCGLFKW